MRGLALSTVLTALLTLGLVAIGPLGPWAPAPVAEAQRAAIDRSGRLDDADYIIQVPENWRGGLVVFAHGIQRGPGRGDVRLLPIAPM